MINGILICVVLILVLMFVVFCYALDIRDKLVRLDGYIEREHIEKRVKMLLEDELEKRASQG